MTRLLLLPLILLACAGCSAPRQINPGALVPIYEASERRLNAEYRKRGGDQPWVWAFYDRSTQEMWLRKNATRHQFLADGLHEFAHHVEADFPGIWALLDDFTGRSFHTGARSHGYHPDNPQELEAQHDH